MDELAIQEMKSEIVQQLETLEKKYLAMEQIKKDILEELPTLREQLKEELDGTIVYKKICCHKKNCKTCGGTRNEHGPYPHLQWRDEHGKLRTRYISKKNLNDFEEQLALSKQIQKRERILVKINERQQKIFLTLNTSLARMKGKEVNSFV